MESDPCKNKKWKCNKDEPLWRMYMNSYLENEKLLIKNDKFDRRKAVELPRLPALKMNETIQASQTLFPLNTFNTYDEAKFPGHLNNNNIENQRIWNNIKSDPLNLSKDDNPLMMKIKNKIENHKWPCDEHNYHEDKRQFEILKKRKEKYMLPCQDDPIIQLDLNDNFSDNKELGHARVPVTCFKQEKYYLIDRSIGDKPGLVDGDYIIIELSSSLNDLNEKLVYSQVCLRGLKGMHLMELNRQRDNTWKFCFYQCIVALLAKTQLRYKHATSINIDYIYDHAWMIFIHMGFIKINKNIKLDDIVVYNYKYKIQVELIDELVDIPIIENINLNYMESNFVNIKEIKRPELMKINETIGWEKIKMIYNGDVHDDTKDIEYWLDTISSELKNFIIKTNKFSLACWNDGNFWYLYNPYRCDKFGYWNDNGYACIMKFCTKKSLNRHIVVVVLRAYAYKQSSNLKLFDKLNNKQQFEAKNFTIQIFKIIYHCVKIHDYRVLQRKPKSQKVNIQKIHENFIIKKNNDDNIEDKNWLDIYKITWNFNVKQNNNNDVDVDKSKWHNFMIKDGGKIYSLLGDIHPTETIFHIENRGKQIHACYIVCAGMMKIMSPEYWSSKTLNTIVMCGDKYYTSCKYQSGNNEKIILSMFFKIGNIHFEYNYLRSLNGKLYTNNSLRKLLDDVFKKYKFVILTCENYCLGLFKSCGAYYMFDVKSIGPPLFDCGYGFAYLLRTTCFAKFLHVLILTIGSNENSDFSLNPIDILKTVDLSSVKANCI